MKSIEEFKNFAYSFERKDYELNFKNYKIAKVRKKYWESFLGDDFINYEDYLLKAYNIDSDRFECILEESNFKIKNTVEMKKIEKFLYYMQSQEYLEYKLPKFYVRNNKNKKVKPLFYDFYKPFINVGVINLKKCLKFYNISEDIINQFTIQLINKLINITYRTIILELNIAKENEKLIGENKYERYEYFTEHYIEEHFWDILEEYPVMLRLMVEAVNNWVTATFEFIKHFYDDIHDLKKYFFISDIITKVDLNISDSHNNGKSVIIVHSENGKSVVYKPRTLELDEKFQETIKLFNRLTNSNLYTYKVIDKRDYGWSEYISYESCSSELDMQNYYDELGKLLFILYVLRGNDVHYENIIAHGKHPVLIDIETIFHNKMVDKIHRGADDKIYETIENSVRRVGILPNIIWGRGKDIGVDVSAMTNDESKEIPIETASILDILTDEMRIDYKRSVLEKKNNTPFIKNKVVDTFQYKQELKKGFINSYRQFLSEDSKKILLKDVDKYNHKESRQILRATQYYSSLIQLSFHPDFMRSGLDREMLFSKLWTQVEEENKLKRISGIELLSLIKNDIPMFVSKIGTFSIEDKDNNKVENFYKETSINLVKKNIADISEEDLRFQILMITTALNYDPKYNFINNKELRHDRILKIIKKSSDLELKKSELIEISEKIANHLIELSYIGDNNDISWMDMNIVGEKTNDWNIVPVGMDLYNGISGILIYFIYLYKETKNHKYFQVIEQCFETIRGYFNKRDKYKDNKILFGGFSGETPIIYALIILEKELNEYFDSDELELMRSKIINSCEKSLINNQEHDVIIGSAGVILILLKYYEHVKDKKILSLAERYADKIMKDSIKIENALAWKSSFAKQPLGGFAHGTSGIIFAFAKLYKYVKNDSYLEIIEKGMKYEDMLYRDSVKNWSDRRETDDGIRYDDLENHIPVAWCHGASGILLSRLYIKNLEIPLTESRKSSIDSDISNAIETSLKFGFGRSHCLCHGDLGNIEILNYASRVVDKRKIKEKCDIYMEYIKEDLMKGNWKCGIPYDNSPGIMVGLAGIGYGVLKVYNPTIPSILILE